MTSLYSKHRARTAVFHTMMLRPPAQISGVISYILLVRLLSESDYGVYNLFYALLPLLAAVASFGLEHTLRRYQPEYLKRGENGLADLILRRIALLRFLSNLAVLALIFALWPSFAQLFKIEDYQALFVLFAALALAHFQCSILTIALSSHLLQKHSLGMYAAFSILKAALYAILGYGWDLDLWRVFLVDLCLYLVLFAGLKYYYTTRADRGSGTETALPRAERWRLFKYGMFYNFNDAGTLPLRTRTDNFFIAGFLDPVAVGAYAFMTQLSHTVYRATPLKLLESVVRPLFFSLNHRKNAERVRSYFSLLLTLSLVVMIPVFFFMLSYHRALVEVVFAGKFLEHSHLLPAVFFFAAANAIDLPVTLVAQLKEKAHIILASRIFSLYNVAALVVLIPWMGIAGAIVASGTAMLMKNLFVWWFVRDLARWKDGWRFLGRTVLIWIPFVALAGIGMQILPEQPILVLALGVATWGLLFAAYLRFGALTSEQRLLLGTFFPGRETRLLRALGVVH